MKKECIALLAFLALSGCATTYNPIPEGYTGPTAKVSDSGLYEDNMKGQFFIMEAIDGNTIDNSIIATRKASHGKGFYLSSRYIDRLVPAKSMKVKLVATHQTAAPIHEITSRVLGTFFRVEGEVNFNPSPGGTYIVKGDLKKDGSSVWIEDENTKQIVTDKVVEKQ